MATDLLSPLADLTDIPLDKMTGEDLDDALGRIITAAPSIAVAAFNSAI